MTLSHFPVSISFLFSLIGFAGKRAILKVGHPVFDLMQSHLCRPINHFQRQKNYE